LVRDGLGALCFSSYKVGCDQQQRLLLMSDPSPAAVQSLQEEFNEGLLASNKTHG